MLHAPIHLYLEDWLVDHCDSSGAWSGRRDYPKIKLSRALEKVRSRSLIIQAAMRRRKEPFSKAELCTLFGSRVAIECFAEKLGFPEPEISKNAHNGTRYAYSADLLREWLRKYIFYRNNKRTGKNES